MSRRIRALFSLGLRSVATEYPWLWTQCPVICEHFYAVGPVPSWTLRGLPAAVSPGSSLISTTLSSGFWWPWPPQTLGSVSSTRASAGSCLVPSVPGPENSLQAVSWTVTAPASSVFLLAGITHCLMSTVWRILVLFPYLSLEEVVFIPVTPSWLESDVPVKIPGGTLCSAPLQLWGPVGVPGSLGRYLLGRPQAAPVLGWVVGSITTKRPHDVGQGLAPWPSVASAVSWALSVDFDINFSLVC